MVSESGEDGYNHHGEEAAGKAHVVEVHAVLDLVGVGRERGQDEPDNHAAEDAQRQACVDAAQGHIAHQRRQRGGQQGHGGMLGKGLLLVLGVQPGAQYNGPDVQYILPKQGEPRHQPHFHHGEAIEGVLGYLDETDGEDHHQTGVHQRRSHAADGHIVRNQQVLHGNDMVQSHGNLPGVPQQDAQQDHDAGDGDSTGKNFFVAVLHSVSSLSLVLSLL